MSQTYNFGKSSFTNELWIANKRVFTKPNLVNVEFTTSGAWDWIISDPAGIIIKTIRYTGGGWTSIHFPSLGLYGDYSIGFKNASPGKQEIYQGDVTYS